MLATWFNYFQLGEITTNCSQKEQLISHGTLKMADISNVFSDYSNVFLTQQRLIQLYVAINSECVFQLIQSSKLKLYLNLELLQGLYQGHFGFCN
jgi:hypothetical protein